MILLMIIYSFFMMLLSIILMIMGMYLFMFKYSIYIEWLMLNFNSMKIEILLLLDYMSLIFFSIVMLISSMVMLYSIEYMKNEIFIKRFIYLVMLFVFSMCLMILSPNIFSIMLGWDGLGLISYCLIIFYQNYNSYNSGFLTILCNRIGDVSLLMMICMFMNLGTWNGMIYNNNFYSYIMNLMLILTTMTKSAQLPFSLWLPAAMTAPTPVSSLVHSSTLVTAGVYLLIRYNKLFMLNMNINMMMLYISLMTTFMASLMANFEYDLKKIIALSTLSQLGLMMLTLSVNYYELAFFHMIIHALFKSLMFLCAGDFIHLMNNNQDIRKYGNMLMIMPMKSLIIIFSLIMLMGFPFLSGFYSKDLIIEMLMNKKLNYMFYLIYILSMTLTISYSIRMILWLMFYNNNFMPMMYFKENKLMTFCMMLLLIFNFIFSYNVFNLIYKSYLFNMHMSDKLMILNFYMYGFWIGLMMFNNNMYKYKNFLNFIMSMFFSLYMFKFSYKNLFNLIYKYEIFMEKAWLELLFGMYMFKLMFMILKL
uniref:NADH-ubiquinone oxidoreductase chain 5 n=1 Tax=Colletes gigas TaxID=935657 RepID=A0A0U1YJM6_9HYME|nr:NADH dehydrogenase subunit 5 [Colletes gigas]